MRLRVGAIGIAVALISLASMPAPAPANERETEGLRFPELMRELARNPDFVEAVIERLGRSPASSAMLGPLHADRLRELIQKRDWEALDRFPTMTVAGIGRAIRLAAAAKDDDQSGAEEQSDADEAKSAALEEPLGIPTGAPSLARGSLERTLDFELVVGDAVDPEAAPRYPDSRRLAEVLNRLALNPVPGQPGLPYRVTTRRGSAESPARLIAQLLETGHQVEVRDARTFANFGDLRFRDREVLTPFWMNTGIEVPEAGRDLLVPASHSQHELRLRGPQVNADLAFFFGIDGAAVFRPMGTLNQAWTRGRTAWTYRGDQALEVIRLAGEIARAYAEAKRAHPELPFGGYYALGVCNDVNAMIELHMHGRTTLYPLTRDLRLFRGEGEVTQLARRLPVDGREGEPPELRRILGSLPVADLAELPFPELRRDLEAVRAAWERGETVWRDPTLTLPWALLVVLAAGVLLWVWRRRRSRLVAK
jgi:hypothetical protein